MFIDLSLGGRVRPLSQRLSMIEHRGAGMAKSDYADDR